MRKKSFYARNCFVNSIVAIMKRCIFAKVIDRYGGDAEKCRAIVFHHILNFVMIEDVDELLSLNDRIRIQTKKRGLTYVRR